MGKTTKHRFCKKQQLSVDAKLNHNPYFVYFQFHEHEAWTAHYENFSFSYLREILSSNLLT